MYLNSDNLKKERKKLKRYFKEQKMLEKITTHIKNCQSYEELATSPISKMYGFEHLKHQMNEYYSFNLNGHGGTIRVICSINLEENLVVIEFISMKHYEDFKEKIS